MSLRKFLVSFLLFIPLLAFGQRAEFYGANYVQQSSQNELWTNILSPVPSSTSTAGAGLAIDWSTAGVAGGIPSGSWTQCTTGACATANSAGTSATAAQINSALTACGTAGSEYVLLAVGTYSLTASLSIPSNCELRGAAPSTTIVKFNESGSTYITIGNGNLLYNLWNPSPTQDVSITSGATAGSTSIVVSSTSGISAGMDAVIDQLNDGTIITSSGSQALCTQCDGGQTSNGSRAQGQVVRITNVNSGTSTLTISPALFVEYARTPLLTYYTPAAKNAGIGNLQIYADNGTANNKSNIQIEACDTCWIYQSASNYTYGDHIDLDFCYHCQIDSNYFSNTYGNGPGGFDHGVTVRNKTTLSLIQNNIFDRTGILEPEWGPAGDVLAYNYLTGDFSVTAPNFMAANIEDHGANPQFILVEGNVASKFNPDSIWGSATSYTTLRNWWTGADLVCGYYVSTSGSTVNLIAGPPFTSGLVGNSFNINGTNYTVSTYINGTQITLTTSAGTQTNVPYYYNGNRMPVVCSPEGPQGTAGNNSWWGIQANRAVEFNFLDTYANFVGDVVGSANQNALTYYNGGTPLTYSQFVNEPTTRVYDTLAIGMSFGYFDVNSTNGSSGSSTPYSTATFYNEYNFVGATPSTTCSGSCTHAIPPSFYLATQPSWWNGIPWPAVGSDLTSGAAAGGRVYSLTASNPAQNCYFNIMGGSLGGPGSPLDFNPLNCYGNLAGPLGFAALPTSWVNSLSAPNGSDNPVFYPASGTYDQTITLATSVNHGPNLTSGALGSTYPATLAGFLDAINNWRDNGANTSCATRSACSTPVDAWWLVQVPAGTTLHGSTFDSNNALASLPGKSLSSGSMVEVTKGLVIDSTTPLTAGQIVCSHGLPGFGGTRNPGCASPNDKSSMFTIKMDTIPGASDIPMYAGVDLVTSTNYVNHVLIADMESTMAPGASQSKPSPTPTAGFFRAPPNIFGTSPPTAPANVDYVAVIRSYFHGWNPGDAGQPTTGSSVDGSGNCLGWYNSGTVNVVNNGSTATITLTSTNPTLAFGNNYFGPTFTVGSSINFGGTMSGAGGNITGGANFVISAFDPTTSNTVLTVTTVGSNPVTATGVNYLQINPPSQYTPGCGDDAESGVAFNVNNGWFQDNYIEKIHWWGGESHAVSFGFDNGPTKITHNYMEGGSNTLFSGGSAVDTQGGPGSDNEIRGNYFGRDLNWRLLSATASNSPVPPWGCGPYDGTPSHNTCPFDWSIKNSLEMKMGHRNLVDGNIIENSWSDAQSGFCYLINVEAGSGGQAVGIFDSVSGLPKSYIDNIRTSNNWIRNCPQPVQMNNRGDMSPADGGGVTLPVQGLDFINNLFSNVADTNQFGSPGHEWEWTSGGGYWTCAMGYTGSGPYTVTANCAPYQTDLTNPAHVSSITVDGSHNVTILHGGIRLDPTLSTSASGTCITSGNSWTTCPVVVSGVTGLTSGSYAMTGAGSTNWATDGTGGTEIVYNDGASAAGTICSSTSTCTTALGGSAVLTFASLAGKLTDISVGDGVYASNVGGGDTTCTANGYAVGATSSTLAISGTLNTGLVVKYSVATQPSSGSGNCLINNGVGFPKNTTVQNNTILAANVFAITASSQHFQPLSNHFFNNVFADNDSLTNSDMYGGGEGTAAFSYWYNNTFEFYNNVMMGRSSSNWSVVNCPGGSCANSFPALTGSYPTGSCANASAPFNCTLMALPWASNFSLSNLATMSITSTTQGVNATQLTNAIEQNQYVCPVGASCGAHGPFPE